MGEGSKGDCMADCVMSDKIQYRSAKYYIRRNQKEIIIGKYGVPLLVQRNEKGGW